MYRKRYKIFSLPCIFTTLYTNGFAYAVMHVLERHLTEA